jgi:MFS family permease
MCMVIGACNAPSFASFTTFRALQGLFGTVPQVIGLPIIHDLYRPKDWPRMINIWGTTFLVGPFLGPALAGYMLEGIDWRDCFKVLAGLYGLSSILVIAFGRETCYPKGQNASLVRSFFGTTHVPKLATMANQSMLLIRLILKPPILLVGMFSHLPRSSTEALQALLPW